MIFKHHINHFLRQILINLQRSSKAAGFLSKQYQILILNLKEPLLQKGDQYPLKSASLAQHSSKNIIKQHLLLLDPLQQPQS